MEKLSIPAFTFATKTYCLLMKPGIIFGNVITTAGGFALASKGHFNIWLFFITLMGISLVIASACVFNNYIDRDHDKKMNRTKNRALALGIISSQRAILFAIALVAAGVYLLAFFANLLTVMIALFGFFVYVFLYSFSKYRSVHGTLIGSVAGAVPPVVGYCAVSNQLDLGAIIFFVMLAMWQMPHFFAIAIYRIEDYTAASIPILPIKKGVPKAKIHMLLYICAFMAISSLLTIFGYTGYAYLAAVALLGIAWLWLCIRGFKCENDQVWARKMFALSLVVVMGLCIMIPFST
ncbi:MAG: Protoheme IX farnesyltransferase [Chlamydiae bacterium]|nr:Protoheme IX farnesyltransferase [Chlamydiota bacterium]